MPLRFRLHDDDKVDLTLDTEVMVNAADLQAFAPDGGLRPRLKEYNAKLKQEIERYRAVIGQVYFDMVQSGAILDNASFREAVKERLQEDETNVPSASSLVGRFRLYLEEEHEQGRISDKMLRESMGLSRKLERYLIVRNRVGLKPAEFSTEMVTDFEKFCVDEYLYAANPKYAALYPRNYGESRAWPKRRLKEEPFQKLLNRFYTFWNDMVLFGEIEKSPYEGYVPWMEEKKEKWYSEIIGEPFSLNMDEFRKVIATPVPERLASTRYAFILQVCIGCRWEDLAKLKMSDVGISKDGIPYIYYKRRYVVKKGEAESVFEIEVPLVRIAFDIVMRTRFRFRNCSRLDPYNRRIQELLRFCGITREVCLLNHRTEQCERVRICDAFTQGHCHYTHMDILHDAEQLRGIRGQNYTGARAMVKMKKIPVDERFANLNYAFAQAPYRVDENLNIIEGVPFREQDPMVYQEQPDKLGGRTNPYLISELLPMPEGEGKPQDRVSVRYGLALFSARKVVVCGSQFGEFMDSLEEEHRQCIQYGIMLLKMLSDFKVTFVRDCKDTIYELRSALRGYAYSTYFYLNGDTIVLLHGCLDEKHRRHKASGSGNMPVVRALRWMHVTGEMPGEDYDGVLDGIFGARGTTKREVWEMRACASYVSQALRQARIDAGMLQEELFSKWGLKDDCGALAHAENGNRVLPYKYLCRHLEGLGLKAVLVRPGLIDWNPISHTKTLEQMRLEIGETVYRWHRKEPAQEEE